jgi:hypothetical protein
MDSCLSENNFWRYFLDVWVYGLVTSNDSIQFLLYGLTYAVFGLFFLSILTPFLSVVYSIMKTLLEYLELVFQNFFPYRILAHIVHFMNSLTNPIWIFFFSFSDWFCWLLAVFWSEFSVVTYSKEVPQFEFFPIQGQKETFGDIWFNFRVRLKHNKKIAEKGMKRVFASAIVLTLLIRISLIYCGCGPDILTQFHCDLPKV